MGKLQDLMEASRMGNIAVVAKLVDHANKTKGPFSRSSFSFRRSPSVNGQDMNGYTPLHHACLNGHSEVVRLLLTTDAKPDVPDVRGSTPLYLAAWAGHAEIVKLLLMNPHKPANPNAQTIDNETPVHCAAQHGHNSALAILLSYGGDPTIRNNSFQTPLDLAAQFGRLQVVQLLIRTHPELIAPFRSSDERSEIYDPEDSLSYPITPKTHIFTHTCLHLASRNGHKKVVEALLAAGVDVNILTHTGSALHEAALCGKKSVVETLLQAGVDPNAKDGNGRTALDILEDYPPHVTYEIASTINDFCKRDEGETHFKPIRDSDTYEELEMNCSDDFFFKRGDNQNSSHTMPRSSHRRRKEKQIQSPHEELPKIAKITKSHRLSSSMTSLEQSPKPGGYYLQMRPIKKPKSTLNVNTSKENTIVPMFRFNYNKQPTLFTFEKSEYVPMSAPQFYKSTLKKPIPSPRKLKNADYVNTKHLLTHNVTPSQQNGMTYVP